MIKQQKANTIAAMRRRRTIVLEREANFAELCELSDQVEPYRRGSFDVVNAEVWLAQIGGGAAALAIIDHSRDAADAIYEGLKDGKISFQTGNLENIAIFSMPAAIHDKTGASRRVFFGLRI